MDPLDFLENKELLRFFRCNKTEMSCMENPHTFLSQLRDHNLIPEDRYKKVSRMKSKDNLKKGLYGVLDWLERERSQHIKVFWGCVFRDTIMNQYPKLQMMRNSLMDGSFHFTTQLPERVEKEEQGEGKRKELSEDEEGEKKREDSVKKKRKLRSSVCNDDEEEPGPSSKLTPSQKKKSKKICFSPLLKNGEKNAVWTWPLFKSQLQITCGDQKGILIRAKLAKGEKCILVDKQWFTPTEFEKFSGKGSYKNWKLSIRCSDTPLATLIQEGHLKTVGYKCREKAKRSLFPSDHLITVEDGDEDEDDEDEECNLEKDEQVSSSSKETSPEVTDVEGETEEQMDPGSSRASSQKLFKVTCGDLAGTLHKKRFASGTCGKSIRTETSWMTPVEFLKEASCQTDASWKKDIKWEGEPLNDLIQRDILSIHSLLCNCRLCKPDSTDLDDQKNDDECLICKSGQESLVECDTCPRSFHQKCHLPHVDAAILGDGGQWVCTFCVFTSIRDCRYGEELQREAAMSRQISQHMLECQYLLLCLRTADEENTFAEDPRLYLSDYSKVVSSPMWLCKVADKLQEQLYRTVGEFVSDVQLIFTNCASYNRENADFLARGNRLKEFFDREFKTVFSICE